MKWLLTIFTLISALFSTVPPEDIPEQGISFVVQVSVNDEGNVQTDFEILVPENAEELANEGKDVNEDSEEARKTEVTKTEGTEVGESTETVEETTERTEATEAAEEESTESTESTETAEEESTESTESTETAEEESTESTEATETAEEETTESTEATEAAEEETTESTEATENVEKESAECTEMTESTEKTENSESAEVTEVTEVTEAAEEETTESTETTEAVKEESTENTKTTEVIENTTEETEWNGEVLQCRKGYNYGPSGKETWYDLNMAGVIKIMRNLGYSEEEYPYWVREDGCKMFGPYIMVAGDIRNTRTRGDIVETSLGTAMVCDHCSWAEWHNPTQLDIATDWVQTYSQRG